MPVRISQLPRPPSGVQVRKDQDSYAVSGCHTMYLDEGGWFTVQGDRLDADTHANLENLLPGEGAVRIKPEVVIEAVRQHLGRLP